MKKSLLTCYIFILIVVSITIYIFSFIDAQVYHLPKETEAKISYIEEAIVKPETNIVKTNIKAAEQESIEERKEYTSLGEFKLTAYCSCEKCCGIWAYNRPNGVVYGAIGEELKEGYSIAVDPNVIPYGTEVIINEKVYKAQDCGGAIKGNRIDVYFDNHNDALEFGVKYEEIFLNL